MIFLHGYILQANNCYYIIMLFFNQGQKEFRGIPMYSSGYTDLAMVPLVSVLFSGV